MMRFLQIFLAVALTASITVAFAGDDEYLLYSQSPAKTPRIPDDPKDGVLVRTITISRGDTLTRLSRKYSGRSSYFPQILLFNRVKNPDLIYAGDRLRVPVTLAEAMIGQAAPTAAKPDRSRAVAAKAVKKRHKSAIKRVVNKGGGQGTAVIESGDVAELLFSRGSTAFRQGKYRRALVLFDEYLKVYPHSPRSADAELYRADCFLKLAGQQ